jgi:hypothetical protein
LTRKRASPSKLELPPAPEKAARKFEPFHQYRRTS